jgi:hypothetical protein
MINAEKSSANLAEHAGRRSDACGELTETLGSLTTRVARSLHSLPPLEGR